MIVALYIIGAIIFIVSFIVGLASGFFIGFIASVAGGIVSAIIFFALAKILDNQITILNRLYYLEDISKKTLTKEKKTCPKCGKDYDFTYNSCPHCGNRE